MNKIRLTILLFLFFVIPFLAKADISISFLSPRAPTVFSDTLIVSLIIQSDGLLDTVRATVGDRSVLLKFDASFATYEGLIDLKGLKQGQLQLDVYVKSAAGDTQTASTNFTWHFLPVLTIQSPVDNTSYQSKLHIKASVKDTGRVNCAGQVNYGSFSVSFVNKIDTMIDIFPGSTSAVGHLIFIATDSINRKVSASRLIYCDKSPYLSQYFVADGDILDFRDTRVLVMTKDADMTPRLKIINITDQSSEAIQLDKRDNPLTNINQAKLCNYGAALGITYNKSSSSESDSLYVWKNGKLNPINHPLNIEFGDMNTSGDFLTWSGITDHALYLTNLVDLSTTLVDSHSASSTGDDISSDGVIVYQGMNNIFKYNISSKTITPITNDDNSVANNSSPSIDKNNIVYTRQAPVNSAQFSIILNESKKDHSLGNPSFYGQFKPYQLANGYIVFTRSNSAGYAQIWIRRPDTSSKQLSNFTISSGIEQFDGHDKVLFANNILNGTRFYTDSLTTPKAVSGGAYGNTYKVNNEFYLKLGQTLYKYVNLSSSVTAAKITSFSPLSAGTGDTVVIKGKNLTSAKSVTFGGKAARSYTVASDTTILAVVSFGASGDVAVTGYSGTATALAGFTFIEAPTITSFSPGAAGKGNIIKITGTNFNNASVVNFGATTATSFTVVSSAEIDAVVGNGSSGRVTVTTPGGQVWSDGFAFVPTPEITTHGSPFSFISGGVLNLYASTGPDYIYQWTRNGAIITDAKDYTYAAGQGGTYIATIVGAKQIFDGSSSVSSAPVVVAEIFILPASNFSLTITDASCKGSTNGSVLIRAAENLNYNVHISGNGINADYHFTATENIVNLAAGTYNVCFTVDSQSDYEQCYEVVVNEPQDLSVFSTINQTSNALTLTLNGGSLYNVVLNGANYTTTQSQLTLNLQNGDNTLVVSTDKLCQGIIQRHINFGNDIVLYPNPVENTLYIALGETNAKTAGVEIRNLDGNIVLQGNYPNDYGSIQVDLSTTKSGILVLKLLLDKSEKIYKIIKK